MLGQRGVDRFDNSRALGLQGICFTLIRRVRASTHFLWMGFVALVQIALPSARLRVSVRNALDHHDRGELALHLRLRLRFDIVWADFTTSDGYMLHLEAYGRQLFYDILNDSYDVTETKTGSMICGLAMATSNSHFVAPSVRFNIFSRQAVIDTRP